MGSLRRAMKMDMNDVVKTDAFFAWLWLTAIGGFVTGALVVAHVIPFPFWIGICGLVGGVGTARSAVQARRLFRSKGKPQQ
jgi:hypothetical protein